MVVRPLLKRNFIIVELVTSSAQFLSCIDHLLVTFKHQTSLFKFFKLTFVGIISQTLECFSLKTTRPKERSEPSANRPHKGPTAMTCHFLDASTLKMQLLCCGTLTNINQLQLLVQAPVFHTVPCTYNASNRQFK